MRLIDADALIEHLKEYKTIYGVPMTDSDKQVVHCVIGHIKNLEPTAYDVEAVVAELEKGMKESEKDNALFQIASALGEVRAFKYAIKVVRNGGKE